MATSAALHAAALAAFALSGRADAGRGSAASAPTAADLDRAPAAPAAEALAPEQALGAPGGELIVIPLVSLPPAPAPAAATAPPGPDPVLPAHAARKPAKPRPPKAAPAPGDAPPQEVAAQAEPPPAGPAADAPDAGPGADAAGALAAGAAAGAPDGEATPDTTGDAGAAPSAGTDANLLGQFPEGHVVSVLMRFDRLRGTEWAPVAQAILKAMPDYRTLVTGDLVLADGFDLVAVSSPDPTRVTRTLLAVKAAMPQPELRDRLDEPGAPVTWSRVAGGTLGTRGRGARTVRGDDRVFLSPAPPWMVLARPRELGDALAAAAGDLDAAADPAALPPWLARLPELERESGLEAGPALMATMAPRGATVRLPDVGIGITEAPAPERVTLSLEIDPQGFVVRGNLRFAAEDAAASFVDTAEAARTRLLDSVPMRLLLARFNALNALEGLSLVRTGRRVAYATSISISDARAMLALATRLVADYFDTAAPPADAAEE